MIPGTMAWNGASNNRASVAGDFGLTQNGVSIYHSLKTAQDAAQNAAAADTEHAEMPRGAAAKAPETALTLNAMVRRATPVPRTRPRSACAP